MDTWKQRRSICDKVHDHMELSSCQLHWSNTPGKAMPLSLYQLLLLPHQPFPAISRIKNLSTWNFHYISCHVKLSVEFSEETFLLWNLNSKPELISIDTVTLNSHSEFWNCKSQTCSSKSAAWDSFNCSCRVNVLSKRDCFSTSTLIPASESISWTAWTSSAGDTRWSSLPPCSWH